MSPIDFFKVPGERINQGPALAFLILTLATFALLSFVVPFSLGIVSAKFLGYAWAATVLMGSNWGSHTPAGSSRGSAASVRIASSSG